MFCGWEVSASPAVKELLLPARLWINFLMLPFQNIHSGLDEGSAVCIWGQRQQMMEGAGLMNDENLALEVSTWWGGWGPARRPRMHTKLALCKISGGHQEGPPALFSQSEPVCFLWASEPEPVRRAACWQGRKLCWEAPLGEKSGLWQGGPGAPQHLIWLHLFT